MGKYLHIFGCYLTCKKLHKFLFRFKIFSEVRFMVKKKSNVVEFNSPQSATEKVNQVHRTVYVEVTRYDAQGELISSNTFKARKQNGGGFVISYTEKMTEFIAKTETPSVVRIFLYLAHNQQYGVNGVYGFRCTRKHLEQALNITRKSVYSALLKLKDDFLVQETKIDGLSEFMVNPNYVTMGRDKQARIREWNLRWERELKSRALRLN